MSGQLFSSSMQEVSDGYWGICNTEFDRGIMTSKEMIKQRRGNCFTLSEYLCSKLVTLSETITTGICIEVLASKRNYHASAWALLESHPDIIKFDLLFDKPMAFISSSDLLQQVELLDKSSDQVVYYTSNSCGSVSSKHWQHDYEWPMGNQGRHVLFLGCDTGIDILHSLAEAGGINQLLIPQPRSRLPTLPTS